jgi:hypothetical protein
VTTHIRCWYGRAPAAQILKHPKTAKPIRSPPHLDTLTSAAAAAAAAANAGAPGHPPAARSPAGRAAALPRPRAVPPPSPTPPNPTPPQPLTPAAPPSSSSTRPPHPWEISARAWLESFPDGRPPTEPEVDAYIDVHRPELPSLPRSQLHQRLLALRGDQVTQVHLACLRIIT